MQNTCYSPSMFNEKHIVGWPIGLGKGLRSPLEWFDPITYYQILAYVSSGKEDTLSMYQLRVQIPYRSPNSLHIKGETHNG